MTNPPRLACTNCKEHLVNLYYDEYVKEAYTQKKRKSNFLYCRKCDLVMKAEVTPVYFIGIEKGSEKIEP